MIYKSTTNWQNQYAAKQNVNNQKQQKLLFIAHIPRKCMIPTRESQKVQGKTQTQSKQMTL